MLSLGKQSVKTGYTLISPPGSALCLLSVYYITMNFKKKQNQNPVTVTEKGKDPIGIQCFYEALRFPTTSSNFGSFFPTFKLWFGQLPEVCPTYTFYIFLGWLWAYLCFWLHVKVMKEVLLKCSF